MPLDPAAGHGIWEAALVPLDPVAAPAGGRLTPGTGRRRIGGVGVRVHLVPVVLQPLHGCFDPLPTGGDGACCICFGAMLGGPAGRAWDAGRDGGARVGC